MARAFAKFWRDLDAAGLTSDHKACALYCHILCNALPVARSVIFHGTTIVLQPGQMVTSRAELSQKLGLTEKEIRRASSGLEKLHLVGQMRAGKYSVFYLKDSDVCDTQGPDEGQIKGQMRARLGPDEGPGLSIRYREMREESGEIREKTHSASGDAPRAKPKRTSKLSDQQLKAFDQFWDAFAYKRGRGGAEKSWAAIRGMDDALLAKIVEAARKEAARRPDLEARGMTPKMAQGWLSDRRWEDEYAEPAQGRRPYVPRGQPQAQRTEGNGLTAANVETGRRVLQAMFAEHGFSQEEFEDAVNGQVTVTVEGGNDTQDDGAYRLG